MTGKTKLATTSALAIVLACSAGTALAQDGCPDGTFTVTHQPNSTAILYNTVGAPFFVTATAPGGTGSATCNMVARPGEAGYSVWEIQYRGFAVVDADQSANFTASSPGGDGIDETFVGPSFDNFFLIETVGRGPGEDVIIDATLSVDAGSGFVDPLAGVEFADLVRTAFVTEDSLVGSIDQLAGQRVAAVGQLGGIASLLLGGMAPLTGPSSLTAVGALGSGLAGLTGHVNAGGGFSFTLGGGYLWNHPIAEGQITQGVVIGAAVRYVMEGETFRPFAEIGFWGAPELDLVMTRSYEEMAGPVTATDAAEGSVLSLYARAGAGIALGGMGELVLGVEGGATWVTIDGYDEDNSGGNIFAASIPDTPERLYTIAATAAWTVPVSTAFSLTFSGAIGHAFGPAATLEADVDWAGPITGTAGGMFYRYGASANFAVTDSIEIGAFVAGTAGSIGRHLQGGATISATF